MKLGRKGFTLAELLIVVAIIAVLVSIAVPVFGQTMEKARQAADLANLRTAYAEAAAIGLFSSGADGTVESQIMKHTGPFDKLGEAMLVNLDLTTDSDLTSAIVKGKTVKISVDADGNVTFAPGDGSGK